ncbi:hypothetical protein [Rickettsia oklahomensis]|uniref:Uncharacterized protein n=1 Tax=Rickettsia oklahomensis TaxID=3141789 RepID=A0AAU7BXY6_9RICK
MSIHPPWLELSERLGFHFCKNGNPKWIVIPQFNSNIQLKILLLDNTGKVV